MPPSTTSITPDLPDWAVPNQALIDLAAGMAHGLVEPDPSWNLSPRVRYVLRCRNHLTATGQCIGCGATAHEPDARERHVANAAGGGLVHYGAFHDDNCPVLAEDVPDWNDHEHDPRVQAWNRDVLDYVARLFAPRR